MNIEQLVRQQDWICSPAGKDWRDGMLLGNGDIGAMASAPGHLEWILNKIDVIDPTTEEGMLAKRLTHQAVMERIRQQNCRNSLFLYEEEDAPHEGPNQRDTITAAFLRLRFWGGIGWGAPAAPLVSSRLSLYDGVLSESLESWGIEAEALSFVPRGTHACCLRLSGTTQPHVLTLGRPEDGRLPLISWRQAGEIHGFVQGLPGGRHEYAVAVAVLGDKPACWEKSCGNGQNLNQEGDADVIVVIRSSLECASPWEEACCELEQLKKRGLEALLQEHRSWWHRYWQGAYADFGSETEIQRYYTFSLYEVASSFEKAPMPGLNGLGYGPLDAQTPGVNCQGYTHDQNAQIPFLALMPIHRVEMIRALTDTYWNARSVLWEQTRLIFGCEGIYLPLAMNQLGQEYPTRSYRYTICGSAYTGFVLSQAWHYSRDINLLKDHLYPLLREFVMFYASIMTLGADGRYHLDYGVPPEVFSFTRDETATIALLKPCLETVVEGAELLAVDGDRLPRWREILAHYPEFARTPDGALWLGPDIPLNHYFFGGHLWYPFYPCAVVTDLETARKTAALIDGQCVERAWTDPVPEMHYNHEWSEYRNTSAALWRGERETGWRGIHRFLRLFAKENGLFSHDPVIIGDVKLADQHARENAWRLETGRVFCDGQPLTDENPEVPHPHCVTANPDAKRMAPPVLEGSSSFLLLTAHALLQSYDGILRLFPGVPDSFTGSFVNYLARGGFEVSASMKEGRVTDYSIRATVPGTLRWIDPITGTLREQEMKSGQIIDN